MFDIVMSIVLLAAGICTLLVMDRNEGRRPS
jgi:hypothetical protein